MTEALDYLMRRKSLLLLVLGIFLVGNLMGFLILRNATTKKETTYIQIDKWGQPEDVDLPMTGEPEQTPFIAVMQPYDVVNIKESAHQNNESSIAESEQDAYANVDDLDLDLEVDVPLTHMPVSLPNAGANAVVSTTQANPPTFWNVISNVFLAVAGISILALGGYLVYQHFMR